MINYKPPERRGGSQPPHTMNEKSLFEWGEARARTTDPETSHDAAEDLEGSKAARLELIVFEAVKNSGCGLTNHEIVEKTGLNWNTCTPRIRPLVRKGLIVDSGETRPGPFRKRCIVWKVSPNHQ